MTSSPDTAPRHWSQFIREMILFCEKTLLYADGLDRESFQASGPVYDATLWNVALIGEAANHVPATVQDLVRAIPWRDIIDTRNHLIHHNFGIDDYALWEIVTVHLPALLPQLHALLESSGEPA